MAEKKVSPRKPAADKTAKKAPSRATKKNMRRRSMR